MSRGRGHVIVVDDDASFLAAVCRLISVSGYQVTGANRLSDLYTHLPFPARSCVLADIILGGENGLDIPAVLRDRGETAPVIFMSATDDSGTLLAADQAGSVPCLRKPFEADELFSAIETALPKTLGPTDSITETNEETP